MKVLDGIFVSIFVVLELLSDSSRAYEHGKNRVVSIFVVLELLSDSCSRSACVLFNLCFNLCCVRTSF